MDDVEIKDAEGVPNAEVAAVGVNVCVQTAVQIVVWTGTDVCGSDVDDDDTAAAGDGGFGSGGGGSGGGAGGGGINFTVSFSITFSSIIISCSIFSRFYK